MLQQKPSEQNSDFEKKVWFREFSRIGVAGRLSRFSVEIALSPNTVTFHSATFLCFRSFHISEKIGDKKWSAYHDSAWGILSPHSTETFFRGKLLSLIKFLLSQIYTVETRGERNYMIFCRNFFVSQYRNVS